MEINQNISFRLKIFLFQSHIALLGLFLSFLLWGCVGPTTPFGAIHSLNHTQKSQLTPSKVQTTNSSGSSRLDDQGFYSPVPSPPSIRFFPDRQVLHDRRDFRVTISDPKGFGSQSQWRVYYNGFDVTHQLIPTADKMESPQNKEWTLEFKNLRLRPNRNNIVQFAYFSGPHQAPLVEIWSSPECFLRNLQSIANTDQFEPPPNLVRNIDHWSRAHQINPNLLAGLVAQESGFDPQAVSWAKAIGLTQVTPLGDLEISRFQPDWPRATSITKYPAPIVKTMITAGRITAQDDWRLNPELSIRGGLTMIDYLIDYWKDEPLLSSLQKVSHEPEQLTTEVILASYQSGAARVKRAITSLGMRFLSSESLDEARKYVGRVSSYCYHFSQKENTYEKTP
ncbi:MAG: transglycosylase SLT domain-containing protein [Bdellovibrionales bacterium]|nr:transglycosylase SLT domain-containing protein [Bdellovibrionales bacterium]